MTTTKENQTPIKCAFWEPYVGECGEPTLPEKVYCKKHDKERCSVCGKQATTRCDVSAGLMCGAPLCRDHHVCRWHGGL